VQAMVNMVSKDALDQISEGQQALAFMAKNPTAERFQPALTLIDQRYREDQTLWDAELKNGLWP
jgi:hypothetical protein